MREHTDNSYPGQISDEARQGCKINFSFCHSSICNTEEGKSDTSHVYKVSTCLHSRSQKCIFFAPLEKELLLYPTTYPINGTKEDRHFSYLVIKLRMEK